MSEEDGGLPEESSGKLDQTNSVPVQGVGPWKNENDMWTFQTLGEVFRYGQEIATADLTIVLVLDNTDSIDLYPQHKHYWVIDVFQYEGSDEDRLRVKHLTEYYIEAREDGQDLDGFVDWFRTNIDSSYVRMDSYQGAPVLVRSSAYDDSRPATQTGSTTGATNGTTVQTTTTQTPGAATASTSSETLDAFGGEGATVIPGVGIDETPGANSSSAAAGTNAAGSYDDAILRQARGLGVVSDNTPPCLPNTQGTGSGGTAPSSQPYDDAILRQARAAAAGTTQSGNNQQTAPQPVTQPSQQPNNQSAPAARPPSVYIYEPLTPGFDRYDFNSGKKVFTPNNGPSRGNNTPPSTTPTVSEAASTEQSRVSNVLAARASGANIGF